MKVLVTGVAGFIGSTLAEELLNRGDEVLGIDNFNDYYNPEFKRRNVLSLEEYSNFSLEELDFCDKESIQKIFKAFQPEAVAHIGAMANMRYSIKNPDIYLDVNVSGTNNLLSAAVETHVKNFVFASTGSIYGSREDVPFRESDVTDKPLSVYPASKKSAELLGHAYSNIHGLNFSAMRFFNVYGPKGRPDMMPWKVAEFILANKEIEIYGDGSMERDWTYVGDLVKGFISAIDNPHSYEIFNLGRGNPVALNKFIEIIENVIGKKAILKNIPVPVSEAPRTFADISKSREMLGYNPQVSLQEGYQAFWKWYQKYL